MKKLLTILCTFLLALSVISFGSVKKAEAQTAPFTDVPTKYQDAVTYLYCNGVTAGTTSTTFGTNNPVTRAQFVTFLYRMAGSPTISGSMPFKDVPADKYYYNAVLWAYKNGVTSGTSATTFSPDNNVTYQEIFTFIRVFSTKVVKRTVTVRDDYYVSEAPSNISSYDTWARASARWAYKNGIVKDVRNSNVFNPKANATRGDVAFFLYNYYRSFQNRYAVLGVNCSAYYGGVDHGNYTYNIMRGIFTNTIVIDPDKIKCSDGIASSSVLLGYMNDTFGNSTCIDICYLYLHSHGDTGGMRLFHNGTKLTPTGLFNMVNRYKGHFVIMLEACYSGVFVEYFATQGKDRFDILTSSDGSHTSEAVVGEGVGVATKAWANYITTYIDTSYRSFMSLNEVWGGTIGSINSYNESTGCDPQNPSIYAKNKKFVAFTKKF